MNQTAALSLRDKINSAFEHHHAGNTAVAEALYRAVLSEDRDNLNALHLLGLLMHQQSETTEAVALLEHATTVLERGDVQAGHAAIYNNLGNALRAASRDEDAQRSYRRGLALDPACAELHANLGNALRDAGEWTAAVASYRAALMAAPAHAGALMNLACILAEAGPVADARAVCRQLVVTAPNDANAHFLLGRTLIRAGETGAAVLVLQDCLRLDPHHHGALYWLGVTLAKIGKADLALPFLEAAVTLHPDDASAYAELGNVLQTLGDDARAMACFRKLNELRPLTTWSATRRPAKFSVLAVTAPGIANTPPDFLFAGAAHDSHFVALLPGVGPDADLLRRHGEVVVNLISDADQGGDVLSVAAALLDRLGKPVVNHPRRILETGRETVAARLSGIALCCVPKTLRVPRDDFADATQREGLSYPMLLRLPGSHGGEAFDKVDTASDAERFIAGTASETIYATEYVDYRSADGCYRKYRFVVAGVETLPYHLAIAECWKVHHHTTNMHEHVWMQEEEKAFLQEPRRIFSPAHYAAMAQVRDRIGLDFFGIDCSLDRDGNLLLFEVNASVLIHNDNADFPYKTPACMAIKRAFEAMLRRAATGARTGDTAA